MREQTRTRPNFGKLWTRLRNVYAVAGKTRMVSVLDNHSNRKELICRKLGVVCDMDVNRISASLTANQR